MLTTNRIIVSAVAKVWQLMRSCSVYIGDVMGERDYEKYVTYLQQHHPCAPIPTEREYWRMRWAEQELNPKGRCC